jgi:hypothetical protein
MLNDVQFDEESDESPDAPESPLPSAMVEPDAILPPKLTAPQKRGINGLGAKLGYGSREQLHERISQIVGEPIASVNDLTKAQASKVMDQFKSDIDADDDPESKFAPTSERF